MVDPDEEIINMIFRSTMDELRMYFRQEGGLFAALQDFVKNGHARVSNPFFMEIGTSEYDKLDQALDEAHIAHCVVEIEADDAGNYLHDGKTKFAFDTKDFDKVSDVINGLVRDKVLEIAPLPTEAPTPETTFKDAADALKDQSISFDYEISDDGLVEMRIAGPVKALAQELGIDEELIRNKAEDDRIADQAAELAEKAKASNFEPGRPNNRIFVINGDGSELQTRLENAEIPYELELIDSKSKFQLTQEGYEYAHFMSMQLIADNVYEPSAFPGFDFSGPTLTFEAPADMKEHLERALRSTDAKLHLITSNRPNPNEEWLGESFKETEEAAALEQEAPLLVDTYEFKAEDWTSIDSALSDYIEQEDVADQYKTEIQTIRSKGRTAVNAHKTHEPMTRKIASAKQAAQNKEAQHEAKVRNRSFVRER